MHCPENYGMRRVTPEYAPAFVVLVLTRRECEAEGITVVYDWLQSPVHMDATATRFSTVCTPEKTKLFSCTYYILDISFKNNANTLIIGKYRQPFQSF